MLHQRAKYWPDQPLTVREVAITAGVPVTEINRLIDDEVVPGVPCGRKGRRRVVPAFAAPVFAFAAKDGGLLASKFRETAMRKMLEHFSDPGALDPGHPFFSTTLDEGTVHVDLGTAARIEAMQLARYLEAVAAVEVHADINEGAPTLKGTRARVHDVAAAQQTGDLKEMYPHLTHEQVAHALFFADANPRIGRPRRKLPDNARLVRRQKAKLSKDP